jgi:hypothetical protein
MDLVNGHFIFFIIYLLVWKKNLWNIFLLIIRNVIGTNIFLCLILHQDFLFRILKDPCGGKVFANRLDFKHCRQMFNTQKEIMQRVGFTDQVKFVL